MDTDPAASTGATSGRYVHLLLAQWPFGEVANERNRRAESYSSVRLNPASLSSG
jgi:hypothetical protein